MEQEGQGPLFKDFSWQLSGDIFSNDLTCEPGGIPFREDGLIFVFPGLIILFQ